MGSLFFFIYKILILILIGFSFASDFGVEDVVYALGVFLACIALILILYVLFVAVRQSVSNFRLKRSYEYKIEKVLSDIVSKSMKGQG